MLLYKYDEKTKELLGYFEAYLDELETVAQGREVYAIPPSSTFIEPFKPSKGHVVIFVDGKWEETEDNRGLKVYDKKGKEFVITELGAIPEEFTIEKPVILKELKENKIKEINDAYKKEKQQTIKIGELQVSIEDLKSLRDSVTNLDESYKVIAFKDIFVDRENIEEAIKILYIREMLLVKRRLEQIKEVGVLKFKGLSNYTINFDVSRELKRLQKMEITDINKEFELFN